MQIPQTEIFAAAQRVARRFQEAGFRCRAVGGAVRDLLLGHTPEDIDLLTDARPEESLSLFPEAELVGACFGVLLIHCGNFVFETAAAREERGYLDGRHPGEVKYTKDFSVDAARRDFTINAMSMDLLSCEIFDDFGGQEDLKHGIVRTVGEAHQRFSEDYLRMLRCIRFAARYRFAIAEKTFAAIRELSHKCAELAQERVRVELETMLTGPGPARACELLSESGIMAAVLPEVERLHGVEQNPVFHPEGDVFIHTMLMLRHMAYSDARLAWSVLFHDLGKFTCRQRDEKGIHFYNHEMASETIARTVMARLRFSNADADAIAEACSGHMRFAAVENMRPSKLRQMVGHPDFALHLELNRLDCIGCHGLMGAFVRLLDEVIAMKGEIQLPGPLVMGRDLIAAGAAPSPKFKEWLEELFERQLSGEFSCRKAALDAMKDLIKRA